MAAGVTWPYLGLCGESLGNQNTVGFQSDTLLGFASFFRIFGIFGKYHLLQITPPQTAKITPKSGRFATREGAGAKSGEVLLDRVYQAVGTLLRALVHPSNPFERGEAARGPAEETTSPTSTGPGFVDEAGRRFWTDRFFGLPGASLQPPPGWKVPFSSSTPGLRIQLANRIQSAGVTHWWDMDSARLAHYFALLQLQFWPKNTHSAYFVADADSGAV